VPIRRLMVPDPNACTQKTASIGTSFGSRPAPA